MSLNNQNLSVGYFTGNTVPESIVIGRVLVNSETGDVYLDIDTDSRIQLTNSNLIRKSGDTGSGILEMNSGFTCSYANGDPGVLGYVNFLQLNLTEGSSVDAPFVIQCLTRQAKYPVYIFLKFSNSSGQNAIISSFEWSGQDMYADRFYITNGGSGIWNLWFNKVIGWDYIVTTNIMGNFRMLYGQNMAEHNITNLNTVSRFIIARNEQATSLSDAIAAKRTTNAFQ